jgi:hypothetical protein
MTGYTKAAIVDKLDSAMLDMNTLYRENFINYRGKTTDTKEYYDEIIAGVLLNNLHKFDTISPITRRKSYRVKSHNGLTPNSKSNRVEERIALNMFNKTFDHIGRIIDYQIPIKNVQGDRSVGKIDLLSIKDGILNILEIKKAESNETLLRCILEAATYCNRIDKVKLLDDYKDHKARCVQSAILVFKDSFQHVSYTNGIKVNTCNLMAKLNVGMFIIDGYSGLFVNGVIQP